MRDTPRPWARQRGIGTLIGNGWLRESPRNVFPREWDIRSRSAMRKCMFLPVPNQLRDLVPPEVARASVLPAPPARVEPRIEPARRDPQKDVRVMRAVDPRAFAKRPMPESPRAVRAEVRRAWWEDPIAVGSLLILVPPIGLAAVWSSKRYSNDARWALTVMTALTMCLVSSIVMVLALR
jgi:hypothetical protein